jgi:hypothetical protein
MLSDPCVKCEHYGKQLEGLNGPISDCEGQAEDCAKYQRYLGQQEGERAGLLEAMQFAIDLEDMEHRNFVKKYGEVVAESAWDSDDTTGGTWALWLTSRGIDRKGE